MRTETFMAKKTLEALLPQLLDYREFDDGNFQRLTCAVDKATNARRVEIEGDRRVNINQLLPVLGNLSGILLILQYEKEDFISSKALGLLIRSKV